MVRGQLRPRTWSVTLSSGVDASRCEGAAARGWRECTPALQRGPVLARALAVDGGWVGATCAVSSPAPTSAAGAARLPEKLGGAVQRGCSRRSLRTADSARRCKVRQDGGVECVVPCAGAARAPARVSAGSLACSRAGVDRAGVCPCGLASQMLDQPNKLQSVVMNQQHGQVCVCSICPLLAPVVLGVFLCATPRTRAVMRSQLGGLSASTRPRPCLVSACARMSLCTYAHAKHTQTLASHTHSLPLSFSLSVCTSSAPEFACVRACERANTCIPDHTHAMHT